MFDFVPKYFMVRCDMSKSATNEHKVNPIWYVSGLNVGLVAMTFGSGAHTKEVPFSLSGMSLTWYCDYADTYQHNAENSLYRWVALG